jgi:hypothetical protein
MCTPGGAHLPGVPAGLTTSASRLDGQPWRHNDQGTSGPDVEQGLVALHRAADMHMELCRRNVIHGIDYSYGDDMLVAGIAREVLLMC